MIGLLGLGLGTASRLPTALVQPYSRHLDNGILLVYPDLAMIDFYTMITPLYGLPSLSPPCLKLETWFRIAEVPYRALPAPSLDQAPKGKIPFIEYKGERMGDSTLIIDMLKKREGIDLDGDLSATERAISVAFRRMIKENIYWAVIDVRYRVEENWQKYRHVLASALAPGAAEEQWAPAIDGLRQVIVDQMWGHGIGRHNSDETAIIHIADFNAISDLLADKPFLMGDRPTTVDAAAYSYIGNLVRPPYENKVTEHVKSLDNLMRYWDRMTDQYFPEVRDGGD